MSTTHLTTTSNQNGFALPTLIIISVTLLAIGIAILQDSTSVKTSLNEQRYNTLASEAAEAGISYANGCFKKNGSITWTDSKPLKPSTDCNGDPNGLTEYVIRENNFRTTFQVSGTVVRADGSLTHVALGKIELLNVTTGAVLRSYPQTLKSVTPGEEFLVNAVGSGNSRVCAVLSGEAYCWGNNNAGQLGDGTYNDSLTPVKVRQAPGVLLNKKLTAIATGDWHNCVISDGEVYCWGWNDDGQLGNGSTTNTNVPVKVVQDPGMLAGKTVTQIGTGEDNTCAIAGGEVYCWGWNGRGQLGDGTNTNRTRPVKIGGLLAGKTVTAISSGAFAWHMCAIADGEAYCWGENNKGQLGNGTNTNSNVPVQVTRDVGMLAGKTITAISAEGELFSVRGVSCAIALGEAYCWGWNGAGQLGNGTTTDSSVPRKVNQDIGMLAGKTAQQIGTGIEHTCTLASDEVYCWGNNSQGEIGNGTNNNSLLPVKVLQEPGLMGGKTVTKIVAGGYRACAVANNTTYCWGNNSDGQLGNGTTIDSNKPVESLYLRPKRPNYLF